MPRFAASNKLVTDQQVLKQLALLRIDALGVEFSQDYAHRGLGKGHSPYAKSYRNLNGPEQFMVVSGLPMVDSSGDRLTPGWRFQEPYFVAKKNLYTARIQGPDVELVVGNDDAVGRKQGTTLGYSPRLFVNGVERFASAPVLLPVDPWNANYAENVLEWDYGVCKRRLRTVEGRVHGYWIFPANPGGDVLIRYNQTGAYRLKLGPYRQNVDEEFVPAVVFAAAVYPFEISDSATYNPDVDPETTSVDGWARRNGTVDELWATIIAGAGTSSADDDTTTSLQMLASTTTDQWARVIRGLVLFDSSALPDTAIISAGVVSRYGSSKADNLSATPDINVYGSTPASNTALQAADYGNVGGTPFSTIITYDAYATTGYNDFTLNAAGLAAITKTGVSKFSFRNANYDVLASPPPWVSGAVSALGGYNSEQGAGYKPKLVVTYTAPKSANPSMGSRLMAAGAM